MENMEREIIEAPLSGKILEVKVAVGNEVDEWEEVCVIEAMKMENPIVSPVQGIVAEIKVSAGQIVKPGDRIAVIEY